MAYDKIIPLRTRLDHCLDYVLNEEKNSLSYALAYAENPEKSHQLVTGINCEARTAFQEMQATKRRWDKRGGILGYHLIHSYAPGEVTPEQAHAAGVEFARRLLGDRYEAVVSTHLDREHYHCHIVFNSVSFVDGKKYRSDFQSYFGAVRETSNAVSQDYGLSVIQPQGKGKHYAQWDAERRGGATVTGLIRQDIDAAIRESFTFDTFLAALRRQGYAVKSGTKVKHAAVRPPGAGRFFRLDSLGAGYTEADIRTRLAAVRQEVAEQLRAEGERLTAGQEALRTFIQSVRQVCEGQLALLERLPELPVQAETPPPSQADSAVESVASAIDQALEKDIDSAVAALTPGGSAPEEPESPAPDPLEDADLPQVDPFADELAEDADATRILNLDDLQFGRNYTKE